MERFYSDFMEEVSIAYNTDTSGWLKDDFVTSVMLEYLEEAGEVSSPVMCPFRRTGLQLNAYAISEDYSELDLFVCVVSDADTPKTVTKTEVDAAVKRAVQVYQKAINDLYKSFEKDNETYEFAVTVSKRKAQIRNVRICALTNGLVKPIPFKNLTIGNAEISFVIWDIDRLYRCVTSGKMREPIEIDFEEKFGMTIPCIENTTSDAYSVYLAILGGDVLAALYSEYRDRLLERNVRSFLQVKGAVNKGIRDTLRDEPEMFLAYNNGISVTAESVEIVRDENGKPSIRKIRDMQIVNGGQTTASIFNAQNDKKNAADLSKVFVQMKLSVITSPEKMDEIVPRISAFANTQNKVQIADFSSNDPFHRKVEELSRSIWAPALGGRAPVQWFYERARGQYADALAQAGTTAKRKQFKETHPSFTKTDLAKYENTWDQLPYQVSEGAQKNFRRFTMRLSEHKNQLPDEKYYQNLIAKAILFKRTEKLVQDQKYGGYRANIVTYTLAFLSYKTAQRIDLGKIWREQGLSPALEQEIVKASKTVHGMLTNPPDGANISEWCKREKCWNTLKELPWTLSADLESELVPVGRSVSGTSLNSIESLTEEDQKLIDQTAAVPAEVWFSLSKWAKETGNFQPWLRSMLFSVGSLISRGKKPSIKQSRQAMKALESAKSKGFTITT